MQIINPPTGGAVSSFVTRDTGTGNLMLGGRRFRWSGPNTAGSFGLSETNSAYGATVDSDGLHLASHTEIQALLDSATAMNATVIRAMSSCLSVGKTNSIQPTLGVFNAAALEPVDYALQQCAAAGIKLVFPLVDNYQYYFGGKFWYCTANGVTPDGNATQFFTNTTIVNSFKAHISFVLNHVNTYTGVAYKNDPTILGWETGNELYVGGDGTWTSTYQSWTASIAAYIKTTLGAQQLVIDGHGYGGNGTEAGVLTQANVDILTGHAYSNGMSWIPTTAASCHSNGKAFFVGEYTWTGSGFTPQPTWSLDDMLDTIEDTTTIDGDNYWALLPPLESWGDGFTLHYPGDNDNMQNRGQKLADHAKRMGSTLPSTFLDDSLTAANGTLLDTHVGEVGATWTKQDGWTGTFTIQTNRLWASSEAHYYASGFPLNSDSPVTVGIYIASLTAGSFAGILLHADTRADTHYMGFPYYDGSTFTLVIKRYLSGSGSNLNTATVTTPSVGSLHALTFTPTGSALQLSWDGTPTVSTTDTWLPYAGRAGVFAGGGTSTTGLHITHPVGG